MSVRGIAAGALLLALGAAGCADGEAIGIGGEPLAATALDLEVGGPAAVVLVVVDTLRADMVSFGGHHLRTTPFIDRLARRGVVFTAAYAPSSWTVPSMASLHTSLHPASHGIVSGFVRQDGSDEVARQQVLGDSFVTLAEAFGNSGYKTVGVAANRHLAAKLGFGQGFDVYYEEADFIHAAKTFNQVAETHLERAFGQDWPSAWIEQRPFVWLHYFDPHAPYIPRLPWVRVFADDYVAFPETYPANLTPRQLRERFPAPGVEYRDCALPLYESEIAYFDDRLRRLAEKLGVEQKDVLLVFTSDHGEEFAEHGALGHWSSLHEELVRVPLVFYWPRGIRQGARVDQPVSLLDVYPTLVELAGLEPAPGLQGQSLVPLLRGDGDGDSERELLFQLDPPRPVIKALRAGRWKLIRPAGALSEPLLFDLDDDPGEQRDVAREYPAVTERLERRLGDLLGALPPAPAAELTIEPDPDRRRQLEELGYLAGEADGGAR
jgi:arylsulfatase A-like enzyme